MVDMSGIPRGFDVGAMRRELADLKREVALLASRRNYVALDRIVEGGTIDAGVGDKLTETVQEKIVVNGENLSLDALDGRVITGSTVQTDVGPETGAKMTTAGFVAHGRAQVSPSIDTKVQSTLGARPAPNGGPGYIQPGLWIDATPDDGYPYTPPQYSAGVFAAEAFAGDLGLRSARDTLQASYTQQSVGQGYSSLISYGPEQSSETKARRETRVQLIHEGQFDLSAVGPGTPGYPGEVEASVSHEADGVLRLKGKNGVDIAGPLVINGAPYTPGGGGTLEPDEDGILRLAGPNGVNVTAPNGPLKLDSTTGVNITGPLTINGQPYTPGTAPNPSETMRTVITGLPAGAKPIELIGTGSAVTSGFGVFTITFPTGVFPTTCMSIQAVPTTGTAGIPVVNAGRLNGIRAEMVIPSATNTNITYSYRAVGY